MCYRFSLTRYIPFLMIAMLPACDQADESLPVGDVTAYYVAPHGSNKNPGTREQPWATPSYAARQVLPGQTVFLLGGTYHLTEQIQPRRSGQENAWIAFEAAPGEKPVLDGSHVDVPSGEGIIQLEGLSYIRVKGLTVKNSGWFGLLARESDHIAFLNNTVESTFSSGIAAWDDQNDGNGTRHIQILGNTVIDANTHQQAPPNYSIAREAPHEAISVAGAHHFEVAYNHVHHGQKEGIDIKETSSHGTVHHNLVHDMQRQALYIDAWFGPIEEVEMFENVAFNNRGAGIAVSVEEGAYARNLYIHHNLLFDNLGTGVYFSRWGRDGERHNIRILHNTVHHNGYGQPAEGKDYFWMTGGLYLYSANLQDILIRDNIFSENNGFQIGYSEHYLESNRTADEMFGVKKIEISNNLVYEPKTVEYPILFGWEPDNMAKAFGFYGTTPITGAPQFVDSGDGNFTLMSDSPAKGAGQDGSDLGAFPFDEEPDLWWKNDFPPLF